MMTEVEHEFNELNDEEKIKEFNALQNTIQFQREMLGIAYGFIKSVGIEDIFKKILNGEKLDLDELKKTVNNIKVSEKL